MNIFALLALPLALLLAAPATAQDAAPQDPPRTVAWANTQQAALHSLTRADGWFILEGGVRFRRIAGDGTGGAPTLRDRVKVNYTGRFADGEVFDSNQGRPPVNFPLSGLIRAWQIAIPYMGIGDTAEIAVPMEMGYGIEGAGPIPGGATLLFTIELVDVVR